MNDAQLLRKLAATDVVADRADLPAQGWSPETAFAEIERRTVATHRPTATAWRGPRPTTGWLVAAAAFVAVVLVGAVLFLAGINADNGPVATTTPPPTTMVPPTTVTPPTTVAAMPEPIAQETQGLLSALERAYNKGDTGTAAELLAPGAEVSLAPWVTPVASPSSVSLPDRVATAALFDEAVAIRNCAQLDGEIRCEVRMSDRLSDLLALEPWMQTWTIEVSGDQIVGIDVSGEDPARADAMDAFATWVAVQERSGLPLVAGPQEWERTPESAAATATLIVEYAALQNGVSPSDWVLISDFYASLSRGDVASAEAVFAPGGRYVKVEFADAGASDIGANAEAVGSPILTEYFTWWYDLLQMEWVPLECAAASGVISCRTESRGVATLHLPGRTATGLVQFTMGAEGIELVEDRVIRGSGSSEGGGTTSNFDIRGFWRTWMPDNEPELEALWPGGNGNSRELFTAELARIILDLYPAYLVDNGIAVPERYLDGSMLADL